MKLCFTLGVSCWLVCGSFHTGYAQSMRINPGEVYTLESSASHELLDVRDASMEDSAPVDSWTPTGSDAERWVFTRLNKHVYTITNVASGKLLHLDSAPSEGVQVNQSSNKDHSDVRWIVQPAGRGCFYLKPAADTGFALQSDTSAHQDVRVYLSRFQEGKSDKWSLKPVAPQHAAPTLAIADRVFNAWYSSFKIETSKGFWDRAEMMEILLDAYQVTKDAKYLARFGRMYDHFIQDNQADWMYNKYNDDITWAVLACVRAYLLSGNKVYLEQGKRQFDEMYARAFTPSYGGGLIWYETKTSKNACINGPAMVACCYLAQATGDTTYYRKAIHLYDWSKIYLLDTATGKVNDNVDVDKSGQVRISTWSSTYNQGTYLGAAVMLYHYTNDPAYLSDAKKIAQYTRDSMYHSKVMNNEDGGNDLPGFKGIFMRYARKYTLEGKQPDLIPWLKLNARVAYNNRNSHDLIQTKWGTRTMEAQPRSGFGCSTAVSLMMNTLFVDRKDDGVKSSR